MISSMYFMCMLTTVALFCRAQCHSPSQTFKLPSYAKDMALAFVAIPSPVPSPRRHAVNPYVEQYMDLEASEVVDSEEYSV